jgi:nickel-dependent lactate racemase
MLYFERGSETDVLSQKDVKNALDEAFEKIGKKNKVLAIPPDITRFHSQAGPITRMAYEYFSEKLTDVLPAIGTHVPMSSKEIKEMYEGVPEDLFRVHRWREDLAMLGEVPGEFVKEISEGKLDYSWPAQINKLLVEGDYDLILSIGQVVPHEVVGMANYNKNIFVGTGGQEGINKSHYLGAVYGMERMMGRADTPVRKVLNYASENFAKDLPIVYIQTVVGRDENGQMKIRGLYIGDDEECFKKAAELSLKVNFTMLEKPLDKVVVYLDPSEFKSTWLGNKAIYRTRMAIADDGELIILAPGLKEFGEDKEIDRLIRKYGYLTTPEILNLTDENEELQNNLSAAAHLIHGSSEKRFKITYCPGHLSKKEIEQVNYAYGDLKQNMKLYDPGDLKDGYNKFPCGTEIYYISNPAIGLWATKEYFTN